MTNWPKLILAAAISHVLISCTSAQETETTVPEQPEQIDNSINYIEFPMTDVAATKKFYGDLFGWTFTDWGPSYISFEGAGVTGGFEGDSVEGAVQVNPPGVLVVLYTKDLDAKFAAVKAANGEIVKEIFDYPGGRRFHFRDPNGNELAIWSEQKD